LTGAGLGVHSTRIETTEKQAGRSNMLAIMGEAFYNWPALLHRTKSLPSEEPKRETVVTERVGDRLPRPFYAPKTADLSQSDFGCLFPWIGTRFPNAENPERTILLNVRAVLQLFRERGVHVEPFRESLEVREKDDMGNDKGILATDGSVEGWTLLSVYE
jgi:platelet-activating factor acetylhydrolase